MKHRRIKLQPSSIFFGTIGGANLFSLMTTVGPQTCRTRVPRRGGACGSWVRPESAQWSRGDWV